MCRIESVLLEETDWFSVPSTTNHSSSRRQPRIIDGFDAKPGQFPYQALISTTRNDGLFHCGGTLIKNQWVLTTAHCIINATRITVLLGATRIIINEPGSIERDTANIIVHSNFNSANFLYDVALIKLVSPVEFTDLIQPIPLNYNGTYDWTGFDGIVSGWGLSSINPPVAPYTLKFTQAHVIGNQVCVDHYATTDFYYSSLICVQGGSICTGDAGMVTHFREYTESAGF